MANERLNGLSGWRYPSNKNWLRNWYFPWPVNQRGQQSYSGVGYGIDMWYRMLVETTVTLETGCIRMGPSGTMYQPLDCSFSDIAGKTMTYSMLTADNQILTCTGTVPNEEPSENIVIATQNLDHGEFVRYRYDGAKKKYAYAAVSPGTVRDRGYVAAKLEEGPIQTLAHKEGGVWVLNDPPPDPTLELLKCQMYQVVLHSTGDPILGNALAYSDKAARLVVPLPVTMRGTPTLNQSPFPVSIHGKWSSGNTSTSTATIAVFRYLENSVSFTVTLAGSESFARGESYLVYLANDGPDLVIDDNL